MLHIKNTVGFTLFKKVFSLYLIVTIFVTILHMYSEYKNEENKIFQDMNNVEISFKKQLTTAAWLFHNNFIEEIINGILTSRSIIGISYKSQNNSVYNYGVVEQSKEKNSKVLIENKVKTFYKENLLEYSFILQNKEYNNNEHIGIITLYSDSNVILKNLENNFALIIINSFIKTLALWMIFLIFANKYLTKSFFQIINNINHLQISKRDNKQFKFNKNKKNEFDLLKQSFNIVFKRLAKSNLKLNNANEANISLNVNLEKRIKERTNDLLKINNELEESINNLKSTQDKLVESEKMASLGNLVAGVAHEINTPVGISITGITHLFDITKNIEYAYNSNNMSEEEFKEYLKTCSELTTQINSNLQRTAHLVKSFKQIAVDQSVEEIRKFNLEEYVNDIIFSLNSVIKKANVKIVLNSSEDIIINSNPGLFSQIITNLIINSIKHGFKDLKEGNITINLIKINSDLEIIYEDNGKGIPKENLAKIFDPFFTTNRDFGGTGLGLNIIYNIVTSKLKGTVKCDSIESKGTTFNINIKDIF